MSVCEVVSVVSSQLFETLDSYPPDSLSMGILQARILDGLSFLPPRIFLTQGSNPGL